MDFVSKLEPPSLVCLTSEVDTDFQERISHSGQFADKNAQIRRNTATWIWGICSWVELKHDLSAADATAGHKTGIERKQGSKWNTECPTGRGLNFISEICEISKSNYILPVPLKRHAGYEMTVFGCFASCSGAIERQRYCRIVTCGVKYCIPR